MKKKVLGGVMLLVLVMVLSGCDGTITKFAKGDIKDDFCGVHINYQYCKCAFHNEYCEAIGMSKSAAKSYVNDEYAKWVDEQKEKFKENCILGGGITSGNKCKHCDADQVVQDNKCVDMDKADFVPDGPLNTDCSINEDEFEQDWRKYSDFDDRIEFSSRSWEVQQNFNVYEKIIALEVENFELERDMELDREMRLALREYKTALVANIRANLLKAMTRLAYITYTTVKSGIGTADTYSKVLTSTSGLEKITSALKVLQASTPSSSGLAVDTSETSGKVKSIGLNAALEAVENLGDPTAIVKKIVEDSVNAVLPSADITPEEIAILADQHTTNELIDQILAENYDENAGRLEKINENEAMIEKLLVEATEWESKEKERIKWSLINSCKNEMERYEE